MSNGIGGIEAVTVIAKDKDEAEHLILKERIRELESWNNWDIQVKRMFVNSIRDDLKVPLLEYDLKCTSEPLVVHTESYHKLEVQQK